MRALSRVLDRDRVGVFESANRGTVLLDEIRRSGSELSVEAFALPYRRAGDSPSGQFTVEAVDVRDCGHKSPNLQTLVDAEERNLPRRSTLVPF
jgi:transcriptional regulator of aromatic amino acid metabolism